LRRAFPLSMCHNVSERDLDSRRLLWRCRRGMKELDILLEGYARTHLPGASAEQRRLFEQFLELPDPVLADYLLRSGQPERAEWAPLIGLIVERSD
jgi:antitoxin CptB